MTEEFYKKLEKVIDQSFEDEELWFEKFKQEDSNTEFEKIFEENFWDIKA